MNSPPRSSDPRLTIALSEPLDAHQIEERLDEALDPVLSSRRTAQPLALKLAALLDRELQDFTLHWVTVIARTSGEMAYQFAALAPDVLRKLELASAEAWIIHAMDTFDREGLYRGSSEIKNVDVFAAESRSRPRAVTFEDVCNVLGLFVCGLSGRRLRLEAGAEAYTDTEIIHLPARIAGQASRERNFLVYKALATHLWAQTRYGTFNGNPADKLASYPDPRRALALYHYLETARIDAIIARELPGLAREIAALRDDAQPPQACRRVLDPNATAADSLALVGALYGHFTPPQLSYMGALHPELVQAVRAARVAREKLELQSELASMLAGKPGGDAGQPQSDAERRFSVHQDEPADAAGGIELRLDGEPVSPPGHVNDLLQSIAQDLGGIPDEYLVPAGDGAYRENRAPENKAADVWHGTYHEEGAVLYNEWDYKRRHYRKNWCVLRELDVHPGNPDFIDATLARYALQVTQLRRTFELLRGEDKLLKKQANGDDIDFDAVISAYADMRSGMELSERLLVKRHKAERDIAVMFMVDMSGSTKGWINDAERAALVLLCEALDVLGDRYAIYGFSGITRKRCEIYRVKRFDERYDEAVRRRIAGILPQDYTRMGVAIRHLTALLNAVEARTKLLITLSDGKPDDYSDNYRGEYGIEDTRQALAEAHRSGIHPFCITIDREARDYLPHMYGAVNYTVIDDVASLPLKVADIYRRLTTR
jgi:nitric oxide reductase NorD protein